MAGTPLLEIGNPLDLEIVADLLSTDAVQVRPGAPLMIDGWGGPHIRGRVNRVDPAGFVKLSALGIEEQQVRTTIDFVDSSQVWSHLGHEYRVNVHISIWKGDVLTVPFKEEKNCAVCAHERALARKSGQANTRRTESSAARC